MTKPNQPSEIENFKKFFEANLLDGEDIKDCGRAMLLAENVFEILAPYFSKQVNEARLDELEKVIDNCFPNGLASEQALYSLQKIQDRLEALRKKEKAQ